MPDKCCVPNCKGNFKTGPKVSVFGFPGNAELKQKWIHAIKRKEFFPSQRSKVMLFDFCITIKGFCLLFVAKQD